MTTVNWEAIRNEFETTPVTLKELAERYNIAEGTVRSRKCREKWEKKVKEKPANNATKTKPATQREKKHKKNVVTLQKEKNKPHGKRSRETVSHDQKREFCGAKAKQTGQPCRRPAGWGTNHPGSGRCKFHGGCSTGPKDNRGNKNARTHGVYETIIRDRLTEEEQAVFDAISADPNMDQEIKILRFKLLRLLEPVERQTVIGTEVGAEIVTLEVDEVTKAYAIEKLVDGIRKIIKDAKDTLKDETPIKIIDDVGDAG